MGTPLVRGKVIVGVFVGDCRDLAQQDFAGTRLGPKGVELVGQQGHALAGTKSEVCHRPHITSRSPIPKSPAMWYPILVADRVVQRHDQIAAAPVDEVLDLLPVEVNGESCPSSWIRTFSQ